MNVYGMRHMAYAFAPVVPGINPDPLGFSQDFMLSPYKYALYGLHMLDVLIILSQSPHRQM